MSASISYYGSPSLAQANSQGISSLNRSTYALGASAQRLSSGNALTRAGDDVAAFSAGASLRSYLSGYRAARTNLMQASSLLQVAGGGLSSISDMLNRMAALSTQGNSSALTNDERSNLNTEFQLLKDEINRVASNTNFNNIGLLDGTLSGENLLSTNTSAATKATGSITFSSNPTGGQTVRLNGVNFTAGTDFTVGGTPSATASNLADALNASTNQAISGNSYLAAGATITITAKAGGTLGNQFIIDQAGSTASFIGSGATTATANVFSLDNGENDALNAGSVSATGTIGDALVTTQNQTKASVSLSFSGQPSIGETITFDDGAGGSLAFSFVASSASSTQITIGADLDTTLQNAIEKFSTYTGSSDYGIRQLEFVRTDSGMTIRNKVAGNPTRIDGSTALSISEATANASLSASSITGGSSTSGVNTSNITNASFVGRISGFTATYNSADNITASITVGSSTYTSTITDTTPATATVARFSSSNGGYFDVQIAAGGAAVTNQTTADSFANRLNTAFTGLTFAQTRGLSSFSAAGDFVSASAQTNLTDYSNSVTISNVSVSASPSAGQDAVIELTINGETYRSQSGIGESIGAREKIIFTNTTDGIQQFIFNNGTSTQDLSDASAAADFENAFKTALGVGSGNSPLQFQAGSDSNDKISISISSALTDVIFQGNTPDLSSIGNSEDAYDIISTAIDRVTAIASAVGAYQSQIDYATNALDSTITNIDFARSLFEDTDVAAESTTFASETIRSQSAIAVIAQLQQLSSSMLDLVRVNN